MLCAYNFSAPFINGVEQVGPGVQTSGRSPQPVTGSPIVSGMVSKTTKNRGRGLKEGPSWALPREAAERLREAGSGPGKARAHGKRRMQVSGATQLLSTGEPGATHLGFTACYGRDRGPVGSWPRRPQPPESRTSSPASWPWSRHSELRLPEEAAAGCQSWEGSLALARLLGCALESSPDRSHAQGAAEPRPRGPSPTKTQEDATPPPDGEGPLRPATPGPRQAARTWRFGADIGVRRRAVEDGHPDDG